MSVAFTDDNRKPFATINIYIDGTDYAPKFVVWTETQFNSVAGAQPGTAQIVLRDPNQELSFNEGAHVRLKIDGHWVWGGWAYTITRGYWFSDYAVRKWTLSCVDYNTVFDRLFIYNHAHPDEFPDNGGLWPNGNVPTGKTDKDLLMAYLNDTDIDLITPTISPAKITATIIVTQEQIFDMPDGVGGSLLAAGKSLRAGFEDVAANARPALPGSMIFYVTPDAYFYYNRQDTDNAPWSVGEGDAAEVKVQGLTFTKDISTIKNDVILFTNELNPATTEKHFKYRHNTNDASIATHGRFQYSEVAAGFLASGLQLRSQRILIAEGEPAQRTEFTVFRPGLLPGQLVQVISETFDIDQVFPIRQITTSFLTPHQAQFQVSCSFDTGDPYGLLLALRRPAQRGMTPPRFQVITTHAKPAPSLPPYTFVREIPVPGHTSGTSRLYQLSYGYIRYSMVVHIGGLKAISREIQPNSSLDFQETHPELGVFGVHSSVTDSIYCEYQVANTL